MHCSALVAAWSRNKSEEHRHIKAPYAPDYGIVRQWNHLNPRNGSIHLCESAQAPLCSFLSCGQLELVCTPGNQLPNPKAFPSAWITAVKYIHGIDWNILVKCSLCRQKTLSVGRLLSASLILVEKKNPGWRGPQGSSGPNYLSTSLGEKKVFFYFTRKVSADFWSLSTGVKSAWRPPVS